MKTVWKFRLPQGESSIELPTGTQILSAGMQDGEFCLWGLVDPNEPAEPREFIVAVTGMKIPDKYQQPDFIGTIQAVIDGDALVFHVFELTIRI